MLFAVRNVEVRPQLHSNEYQASIDKDQEPGWGIKSLVGGYWSGKKAGLALIVRAISKELKMS